MEDDVYGGYVLSYKKLCFFSYDMLKLIILIDSSAFRSVLVKENEEVMSPNPSISVITVKRKR